MSETKNEKMNLTDKDASSILDEMNRVIINDNKIGNFMRTYLAIGIANNWELPSIFRIIKDCIKIIKIEFFTKKIELAPISHILKKLNDNPLLTFKKNHKHHFGLNKSIYDLIEKDKTCLALDRDLEKSDLDKDTLIFLDELIPCSDFKIGKNTRHLFRKVILIFINNLKKYNISKIHVISFYLELRYQIALFKFFKLIFGRYRPLFILAETDAFGAFGPLISAAKQCGIQTFIHTHGPIIYEIGHKPLLADKIFCWGKFHYDYFKKLGFNNKDMYITGAPHMREGLIGNKKLIKSKLKLDYEYIILIASSNTYANEILKIIKNLITDLPDSYCILIRPHPMEDGKKYKNLIKNNRLKLFYDIDLNTNDSLLISDVVIVGNTAFLYDTIRMNRVPIVYYFGNTIYGEINYLEKNDVVPFAYDIKDLHRLIKEITQIDSELKKWISRIKKFKKIYWHDYGKSAADNIYKKLFN